MDRELKAYLEGMEGCLKSYVDGSISSAVSTLNDRFDRLEDRMDERFAEVDRRFDEIDRDNQGRLGPHGGVPRGPRMQDQRAGGHSAKPSCFGRLGASVRKG